MKPSVRIAVLLIGTGLLLALLPYIATTYWLQLGYRALQLYVLATVWNLLAGYGGQTSLGVAAFVGCGAYALAGLERILGVPWPLLIPVSAALAALLATILGPPMFRLRGLYFTIGTLAVTEALRILVVNHDALGGAAGLIIQSAAPPVYALYWSALLLALLAELTVQWLLLQPLSLALRAVRDDEEVARQLGVWTFGIKLLTFVVSAAFMGAIGGLQVLKLGAIEPYGSFSVTWTIDTVAAVIIGGLGTRSGPFFGVVLYIALGELLRSSPELHGAITGLLVLVIVRCAPRGLAGLLHARRVAVADPEPMDA